MIKKIHYITILVFLISFCQTYGQDLNVDETIQWKGLQLEKSGDIEYRYLYFENAYMGEGTGIPQYATSFSIKSKDAEIQVELADEIVEPASPDEIAFLQNRNYYQSEFDFSSEIFLDRSSPVAAIKFVPIRYNATTGTYEKLISFKLNTIVTEGIEHSSPREKMYNSNSVLSQDVWYKISVSESGIHKMSYSDLSNMGINVADIDPRNLKLYGNGGHMLPEKNIDERYDDLVENAIFIAGQEDGEFDLDDYLLFYGMGPNVWEFNSGIFEYNKNIYDDLNYYFITVSEDEGKRIEFENSATGTIIHTIDRYNDYQVVEDDIINLIYSGKDWYGDEFGTMTNKIYNFNFPNKIQDENTIIKVGVANRNFITEDLVLKVNNTAVDSLRLTLINSNTHKFAQKKQTTLNLEDLGTEINFEISFTPIDPSSRVWLDHILINTMSSLNMINGELAFRNINSIGSASISKFEINNSNENVKVWDISDPLTPILLESTFTSGETSIQVETDILKEFIAFDESNYKTPEFAGLISNQDLHGSGPIDLLIISPPIFKEQAQRLATLHETMDSMRVLLLEPSEIYNEFSSGKQDPTAIRDFVKMLYDNYEGDDQIRYLLLFGDGSFDPKDRIANNTNFVPAFQTRESLLSTASYVVDDYYGLLDDTEGNDAWGLIDIGIGRIPVQTLEEAETAVDKIYQYVSPNEEQFGKWRTKVCLIADDEDGNLHLEQADSLKFYIPDNYNINKIYLDAFEQVSTPTGEKYPEVTTKINEQVQNGALIINYVGHGGISGWSHERVVTMNDINNWTNTNQLPLFVTATCEFSRFDEPYIVSAGENIYRNPIGGGIALLTTTRVAYAQSNFKLNLRLNARAFVSSAEGMPYLGDLIRESKPPGQLTTRNFILLGDPALRLAYPKYNIETTSFSENPGDNVNADTVSALQKVYVKGKITDAYGNKVPTFNGFIFPDLYDKPTVNTTLGNDDSSFPVDFLLQNQIIWTGQYEVKNGEFEFEFMIPKDITLNYGKGKLSYYAYSSEHDASGAFTDFTMGGIYADATADNTGPEIDLYINDYGFVSGGLTHSNPMLIAHIADDNGINLSSNGIGHDISLVLNDDYSNVVKLNDLYVCDTNTYKSGSINYPYYNLPDGNYTLRLKAWDSYNNSNEASINFVIDKGAKLEITQVQNVPNPFADFTKFEFSHTKPGQELDIELQIFDINGQYVLSYETSIISENTKTTFLEWDGRDRNGDQLPKGLYVYQVIVTDEVGNTTAQKQKLLIW